MRKKLAKAVNALHEASIKVYANIKYPVTNNDGWGRDEVIGIAIALVIGAFVMVPNLRTFAQTVTTALTTWWGTISGRIFPTS